MQNENYKVLGLDETATNEEIASAYSHLKSKYSEERFFEGEVGNNAAKMLNVIETAYNEIMNDRNLRARSSGGRNVFEDVENYLKQGNLAEAQFCLDSFSVRDAEWYYYQSIIFYRKKWINDSKKQLEFAMQLQPNNEKYKEAYRRLNENVHKQEEWKTQTDNTQMMGQSSMDNCLNCCTACLCMNCCCRMGGC